MKATAALFTTVLTAFLGIFVLLSCTREDPFVLDEDDVRSYAEARCFAELECCGTLADPECTESLVSTIMGVGNAVGAELTYSEVCMEELLAYGQNIGCDQEAAGSPVCLLGVGRGAHGDECEDMDDGIGFYMMTCRDGLRCSSGRCVDAIFDGTQPAGFGENCSVYISCGTGLYCTSDLRCEEKIPQGEACAEGQVCESGFYCGGDLESGQGTCTERLGPEEPCDPRYRLQCAFIDSTQGGDRGLLRCIDGICAFYEGSPLCEGML